MNRNNKHCFGRDSFAITKELKQSNRFNTERLLIGFSTPQHRFFHLFGYGHH